MSTTTPEHADGGLWLCPRPGCGFGVVGTPTPEQLDEPDPIDEHEAEHARQDMVHAAAAVRPLDPLTEVPAWLGWDMLTPAQRREFIAGIRRPLRRRWARRRCGDWDARAEALEQRSFDDDVAYTSSTREDGPAHRAPAPWPLLQLDDDDAPVGEVPSLGDLRSVQAERLADADRDERVA